MLTTGWSQHSSCMRAYLALPKVIPSVIAMLQSPKIDPVNVQLILSMLKNVVLASLDHTDTAKSLILADKVDAEMVSLKEGGGESDEEMEGTQVTDAGAKETARQILREHVGTIAVNLHLFWTIN